MSRENQDSLRQAIEELDARGSLSPDQEAARVAMQRSLVQETKATNSFLPDDIYRTLHDQPEAETPRKPAPQKVEDEKISKQLRNKLWGG